jgi:hypothetical protein
VSVSHLYSLIHVQFSCWLRFFIYVYFSSPDLEEYEATYCWKKENINNVWPISFGFAAKIHKPQRYDVEVMRILLHRASNEIFMRNSDLLFFFCSFDEPRKWVVKLESTYSILLFSYRISRLSHSTYVLEIIINS